MFTGIIETLGLVTKLEKEGENLHLHIQSEISSLLKAIFTLVGSLIILELSSLLRYMLYDCKEQFVLLEMKFNV